MRNAMFLLTAVATTVLACSTKSSPPTMPSDQTGASATGLKKVNHVVVIVLENWTFDSLYAELPGVEGLTGALKAPAQVDATGTPYATLPQTETHLPQTLANAPFPLDSYIPTTAFTSTDLTNNFYEEQRQIHGGKMDQFVLFDAAAKGLTMGYYHTAGLPLRSEAQNYTVCDHFFHGVFGGSLQNHIFLISAGMAQFPNAPASIKRAVLGENGQPVDGANAKPQDGPLTPDGYVVGTLFPSATPHPPAMPAEQLVPPQTFATIGDRLSAKGLDWAWYSEGWNEIIGGATLNEAGTDPTTLFQYNHQPFVYFAAYAEGTPGRAHLKDETDFLAAATAGSLPAVSFVKPDGVDNEHPNYADVIKGDSHTLDLINAVRNGPNWSDTVIVVTYDEGGGFWDHVAPPSADRWGPGTRVPTIIVSPFAKKGFVDSTVYDASSILALIEHRWGLSALGTRDAVAADLTGSLDFAP
ncbi:MAG TPA: acid phosphatase [Polyangiaceae bacterium]|nr:acid phosphatase [Polyangiaceae bacterium]